MVSGYRAVVQRSQPALILLLALPSADCALCPGARPARRSRSTFIPGARRRERSFERHLAAEALRRSDHGITVRVLRQT